MDAALNVLVRDGYAGVSVASIAREAGVTRPVIYGAFEDLADLLFAVMTRTQRRALATVMKPIEAAVQSTEDTDAFIDHTVRYLAGSVTTDPVTWRPILASTTGVPQEVSSVIEDTREQIVARLAEVLRALLGGTTLSLDPDVTARMVVASSEHHARLLLIDPAKVDVDALVDWFQTAVAGILAHRGVGASGGMRVSMVGDR